MLRFLLMFFMTAKLLASVEDHLKPVIGKEGNHQIGNVDFIYLINLDQRPKKFELCQQELSPYGIYPYRFSAVNGWELPIEVFNDIGVKYASWMTPGVKGTSYLPENHGEPSHEEPMQVFGRTYFCHCMSRGAIGIVLSHLSVLQDAYDSGYETIWIMEDDVQVIRNPHIISNLIEKLDRLVGKSGWDVLFTDRDTKNKYGEYVPCMAYTPRPNFVPVNPYKFLERQDISPDFRRVGARYGAYSMIIRRSGIKKLLNFFKIYDIFLTWDMDFNIIPGLQFCTVLDDVVSTRTNAASDNGGPNYKNE